MLIFCAQQLFGSPSDGRLVFPTMQSLGYPLVFIDADTDDALSGSTGEAAFMTGLERNSDIVFAASYAPLLGVRIVFLFMS